jgi:hypothetical protein
VELILLVNFQYFSLRFFACCQRRCIWFVACFKQLI